MGLFRNNEEDDNSTGSHLYFMGGEVVVHRASAGNATEMMMHHQTSSSTTSPSAAAVTGFVPRPLVGNGLSRNESNYSLPSAASDAMTGGGYYGNSSTGDIAVGLDVSERDGSCDDDDEEHDGDDVVDDIPNAASMETVPSSNLTPRKQPYGFDFMETNGTAATTTTTDYYAQESGGLQAIFESRMTPRHRNAQQQDGNNRAQQQDQPVEQPTGMLLDRRNSNGSANHSYQRTPPTFPDLPK